MQFDKNDILKELEIEALSSDGTGIAKIDGYPVFIKDALPGDTVTAKVMKAKKNMAFAKLLSVETPSPDRVTPKCSVTRPCGGCTLQELCYEKQLEYKDDKVYNALLRIGGIPAKLLDKAHEDPIGMEKPWRYRNKAQYPVGRDKDGKIAAGFYAGRTHHIVETEECYLNPPEFSAILRSFLRFCEDNTIEPYDEVSGEGLVRHLVIRKAFATGEIMVMPVVTRLEGLSNKLREVLREALVGIPDLTTIVLNENPDNTNVILGRHIETIYGNGYIIDEMDGLKFNISPLSFYQVNPVQALKIYDKAIEYANLTGSEKVYDLCCGIGTLSLLAARSAGKVYGIEILPEAIEDAKKNAKLNDIKNVKFTATAAEEYLPRIKDMKADVVILDPPRSGMERLALDAIAKASPARIVYVSCDPATQARDIKVFLASGYRLQRFTVIDQFCHTSHVETVCILSKLSSAKEHIEVTVDMDELDLTSAEAKATYNEIRDWVQEHYSMHVTNLNIAQVKQKHGIIERENYNKPKSPDSKQPQCPEEKIKAIEDAMRHFQMID
ncbi:MAG: 23S rRNA (uracil(1939)-C(5))-methyltransferase RlmD [Lachnospiraceae bacterium]|nr:23S rRNA (uracil(1939)-C(5))-methyltransferase RlmD [Lachnospiraceae bacterium]